MACSFGDLILIQDSCGGGKRKLFELKSTASNSNIGFLSDTSVLLPPASFSIYHFISPSLSLSLKVSEWGKLHRPNCSGVARCSLSRHATICICSAFDSLAPHKFAFFHPPDAWAVELFAVLFYPHDPYNPSRLDFLNINVWSFFMTIFHIPMAWGASRYDVCKILAFLTPSPLVRIWIWLIL